MNYKKLFEDFCRLKVMIVGDVMIDAYIWGKVERISPEAPVPIVTVSSKENRLGGAANVALNIAALGAKPILCSVLGTDKYRDMFFDLMEEQGMDTRGLLSSDKRITTIKKRILGNKAQMLRVDEELTTPLQQDEENLFLKQVFHLLETEEIDVIIFQDYDKGVLTQHVIESIIRKANQKGIKITVDPKKRNFSYYKNVSLFKPNLKELREGLRIDFEDVNLDNLNDAANILWGKQHTEVILITLSEHGIYVCDYRDGAMQSQILPALLRNIADVSGAGDTVISVASLCLALDVPIGNLMHISNLAGGLVCEYVGVVPIDSNRFEQELISSNTSTL